MEHYPIYNDIRTALVKASNYRIDHIIGIQTISSNNALICFIVSFIKGLSQAYLQVLGTLSLFSLYIYFFLSLFLFIHVLDPTDNHSNKLNEYFM